MAITFPLQPVLDLSCSAFRMNGGLQGFHTNGVIRNTHMVKQTLGIKQYHQTVNCVILDEDIEFAKNLFKFFQRLTIDVLSDRHMCDKVYEREIYKILQLGSVKSTNITAICRLPGFSFTYLSACEIHKFLPLLKPGGVGEENELITDTKCQIITQSKCVNYPGYNVHGKINEHLVTWYTPWIIPEDVIVIKQARIKENGTDWFTGFVSSRLDRVYRK